MLLLIIPISDFARLMRRDDGLFLKFGLWSFSVIKHSFSASLSIRLPRPNFFSIFFSSAIILAARKKTLGDSCLS